MALTHYQRMLASGRRSGAVGSAPTILTKYIIQNFRRDSLIVDFGAGKFRHQTKHLRTAHFRVIPFDLRENMKYYPITEVKREKVEGLVMGSSVSPKVGIMSNVLNVQGHKSDIYWAVRQCFDLGVDTIYANYPESPRYAGLSYQDLLAYLRFHWKVEEKVADLAGNTRSKKHRILRIERY